MDEYISFPLNGWFEKLMVNGSVTKLPVGESGLIDVGQTRLKTFQFWAKIAPVRRKSAPMRR
jgi:hypothetical protein